MNAGEQRLRAKSVPRSGRKPRIVEGRRLCRNPECDTVLSRYNTDDMCSVHAPIRFPRVRGRIPGGEGVENLA